jgi:hypothetical protein
MVLLSCFDIDCLLECEFLRIFGIIPCFNEKPWARLDIYGVYIMCIMGVYFGLVLIACYLL